MFLKKDIYCRFRAWSIRSIKKMIMSSKVI